MLHSFPDFSLQSQLLLSSSQICQAILLLLFHIAYYLNGCGDNGTDGVSRCEWEDQVGDSVQEILALSYLSNVSSHSEHYLLNFLACSKFQFCGEIAKNTHLIISKFCIRLLLLVFVSYQKLSII